ncbi:unnamed protein product, partial [Closterium sp. NIES-65]
VEASPQGIVSMDPSSFLASDDGTRYSLTATLPPASTRFDSYAVIRIDRAPLEATLSCDTPFAVVKFFTQLRATPRVSQSPVTCRVLFSKRVSSLSSASLAVVNATTSDPQPVTDLEYQFQVWPTGEGSVVVDIRHDNVTDAAGNTCQPTQPFFFFFDTTAPSVQLSVSESSATTDWVYPILVAFSEPVLGFNTSSIQLSNGVITCWTGVDKGLGRYYEVTVAAVSDGDVTIVVPAATVVDIAGNPNSPSNTLSLAHSLSLPHSLWGSTLPPSLTVGTLPPSLTVGSHSPSLTHCGVALSLPHSLWGITLPPSLTHSPSLTHYGVALSLPHSLWGSNLPPSLTHSPSLTHCGVALSLPHSLWGNTLPPSLTVGTLPPSLTVGYHSPSLTHCGVALSLPHSRWGSTLPPSLTQSPSLTHCGVALSLPHSLWGSTLPPSLTHSPSLTHCGVALSLPHSLWGSTLLPLLTYSPSLTHCGVALSLPHSLWGNTLPPSLTVGSHSPSLTHCGVALSLPHSLWGSTLPPSLTVGIAHRCSLPVPMHRPCGTALPSPSPLSSLSHTDAPGDAGAITAWVVTAVVGWTALSTAAVSLAVTIKESDPTSSPGIRIVSNRPFRAVSTPVVGADPSRNVLRMALHLQVFALTQHLAVRVLPLFYRQLTGGLRWTYFYIPAPFKGSFDGWKGVYSSPTDAPGQDSSTPPPSCAPHYLATKTDSSASSSSNPPQPRSTPLFCLLSHSRQLTKSHVHMQHAMSHPSLTHGRSLGSSRALPFHPIPFSPPPTFHLRGMPLTAPSLPSSFPSSLHSAFPYTLFPLSLSSRAPSHYHRMLQETTASTTSNSSASGYSGFNATALIALAVAGGGTGGDAAAAIAVARGFDPTLLPRLSEEEYEYMQAWGNAYYSHFPNLFYSYHGFEQFCTVLFWFALFFFALSLLQLLFQWAWQHWRYQWLYGLLDPPRLQFLLLALSLAGISWGCTLLIRGSMEPGGTAAGLATGVIVLCLWPVLFLIFSFSVVWYIVVQEQFARFFVREMTEPRNEACIASFARAFWAALRQKRLKGHWVTITPSQKHILPRFGIFFEDFTVWGSVGAWGVLKDRLRAAYGTLDFLKMVLVGALVGAWSPAGNAVAQQACLLTLALLHLLFLLFLQPFTERGLQVVEAVSSGAEVVLFACALAMAIDWDMPSSFAGTLGLVMALAVGLAFIGQLFNHWVALGQQINRMLNPPDDERSPSHRSDGDDFSDNDDDDLDDDDNDEDFDDEDDGNGDDDEDDDDDDDYDDDEEDDDEGDTSMDEAERIRQQQQQQQQQ